MWEKKENVYDYGCILCYLPIENWDRILSEIDNEDIYFGDGPERYGRETKPHVTVLYGLHDDEIPDNDLKKAIHKIDPIDDIRVTGISFFANDPKYDVLKFDIQSPYLFKLNQAFRKFPYTSSYDQYNPHLTIAYLKRGTAKKYLNIGRYLLETELTSNVISYSKPDGELSYFFLDR